MNERIRAALKRARRRQTEEATLLAEASPLAMRQKMRDLIVPHLQSVCLELEGTSGAPYGFRGVGIKSQPSGAKVQVTFYDGENDGAIAFLTIEATGDRWKVTIRSSSAEEEHPDEVFEKDDRDMDADLVVTLAERAISAIYGT